MHVFKLNAAPFAHELPYWAIEDDFLVHVDGTYSKGLSLSGLDTWTLANNRLNEIYGHLQGLVGSLPEDIIFQFLIMSDENVDRDINLFFEKFDVASEMQESILKDRKQVLESSLSRRYRLFLFISKRYQATRKTFFQNITALFKRPAEADISFEKQAKEALKELNRVCTTITSYLHQPHLQIAIKPMNEKEIVDLLYETLNPRKNRSEPAV